MEKMVRQKEKLQVKKRDDGREKGPLSGSTQRWLTQIFVGACDSEQHKSLNDWKHRLLYFGNSMLYKTLALLPQLLLRDGEMVENVEQTHSAGHIVRSLNLSLSILLYSAASIGNCGFTYFRTTQLAENRGGGGISNLSPSVCLH